MTAPSSTEGRRTRAEGLSPALGTQPKLVPDGGVGKYEPANLVTMVSGVAQEHIGASTNPNPHEFLLEVKVGYDDVELLGQLFETQLFILRESAGAFFVSWNIDVHHANFAQHPTRV
eukprot:CAMPEP_0185756590 /NCGR_PEP_ID=MMETSP1174-20130828/15015_1 /TAXON_ID=35687 /ORGANISM="Dictyocha speculum, Strain CCMP1381" /LENGTH=116 /DNA_ID=CAMNT_0028435613 /DNA_START=823 /DNA_END=1174 /DNA_ORIENTATION=-